MTYEELFIEAMENALLCTAKRNEDGSINVEETIKSYSFEAGCSCMEGGWLNLANVLMAIKDAGLDQIDEDY